MTNVGLLADEVYRDGPDEELLRWYLNDGAAAVSDLHGIDYEAMANRPGAHGHVEAKGPSGRQRKAARLYAEAQIALALASIGSVELLIAAYRRLPLQVAAAYAEALRPLCRKRHRKHQTERCPCQEVRTFSLVTAEAAVLHRVSKSRKPLNDWLARPAQRAVLRKLVAGAGARIGAALAEFASGRIAARNRWSA